MRRFSPRFSIIVLLIGLMIPGLALAGKPAKIEKVKYTHIDLSRKLDTDDPMINFERSYLLYGAVTSKEYREREGKYYTVFWESKDRSPGLIIRFEYLQANTGDTIKVKEITIDKVHWLKQNTTDIQVIGDEYQEGGNVLAWRVSLVRDGEVLDTVESYLWE